MTPRLQDTVSALEAIHRAMEVADRLVEEAMQEHARAFAFQIREKIGAEAMTLQEPYLASELARFQLQFVKTMARLFAHVEKLLPPNNRKVQEAKSGDFASPEPRAIGAPVGAHGAHYIDTKAIDPKTAVTPQVEERIAIESVRLSRRVKQSLDGKRQRAYGLRRYIWRSQDDAKVRASHAVNDNRVFECDNPPPTGHPGEDYGCRCFAEPILDGAEETPTAETAFAILPVAVLTEEAVLLLINVAARLKQIQRGAAAARGANVLLDEIQQQEEGQGDAEAQKPPAEESAPTPEPPDDEEPPEGDDKERNSKIAEKISDGHAYEKHVEKKGEFHDIESREDFKKHIEDVMNNPDDFKQLRNGREAYWDDETETIVISDPNNPDGGTAYRAYEGKQSYEKLE